MKLELTIFGKKINVKKIIQICATIGLILLIGASIYLLNHSVLLSPDDYNYSFVQGGTPKQPVKTISDCIQTGKFFYKNWTGRVLPHVIIGIFRNINPNIFEIVNTLVFMLFICLIPKVLSKKVGFLSILSVFGYLVYSMMFGEKFAWISGACNYLWPSAALLIFIYFVYNYYIDEKKLNILGKIAVVLSSFVIGFLHENTAFVGGAFLICLIGFKIKDFLKFDKKKKITIILIILLFGIGGLANIFAPGNFTRMDQVQSEFSWSFLDNYKVNKGPIKTVLLSMIVAFVITNIELFKKQDFNPFHLKNWKQYNIQIIKVQLIHFILPALIATLPMAVIGYFPPRAFLAYELMFLIVLAQNVTIIAEYLDNKNIITAIISIVLVLFVFSKYSPSTLAQINYIIPYKHTVTEAYEKAVKNGEKDVLVPEFAYLPWIHIYDYINIHNFFPEYNSKMPINALISMYYGFDRVTAIGTDEYLVEVIVDTEGINPYYVIEKGTEKNIYTMEYDNEIRFTVPKDKIGTYLLDCRQNGLEDKILNYRVRSIEEDITEKITLEEIIIFK